MMRLSQLQRLSALLHQHEKSIRKLHSVQRRISAILLSTGDLTLCEDTLDAIEAVLADADATIHQLYADVLSAREAADSGEELASNEGECA